MTKNNNKHIWYSFSQNMDSNTINQSQAGKTNKETDEEGDLAKECSVVKKMKGVHYGNCGW